MQALRELALAHPGVEEGIACEGTALERRTVKVRGKAFLFLGASDAMLKLAASLPEAARQAQQAPERYRVGAGGWVKTSFDGKPPPLPLFRKWIAESYGLAAAGTGGKANAKAKKPAAAAAAQKKPAAAQKKPAAAAKKKPATKRTAGRAS